MSWRAEPGLRRPGPIVARRVFLGAAGAFALAVRHAAATGRVSDLSAADRAAIRDVISRQMAAFQRDAAAEAFAFAAPGIRAIFGTPDAFMAMVRTGYMPVYRPRRADFEDPVGRQGRIVQPVRIVGPDGATVLALYDMEAQPDGTWLIAGCSLVAPPGGDA